MTIVKIDALIRLACCNRAISRPYLCALAIRSPNHRAHVSDGKLQILRSDAERSFHSIDSILDIIVESRTCCSLTSHKDAEYSVVNHEQEWCNFNDIHRTQFR